VARVRNFGWWTHQEVAAVAAAWTVKGPKPKIHDDAVARLRKDWPRLADTLDALVEAEERGCPMCPSRYPIYHVHDQADEVVGWASVPFSGEPPPDELLECHRQMGHAGPHQHVDDCATIEWQWP
jgi:hypothetical protein